MNAVTCGMGFCERKSSISCIAMHMKISLKASVSFVIVKSGTWLSSGKVSDDPRVMSELLFYSNLLYFFVYFLGKIRLYFW